MIDKFIGFVDYSEEEIKDLWEKATFVVDTNILINFYKYTNKDSTKSLLDILKKLKEVDRLWIPHQVALEYFFNFEENMLIQEEGYKSAQKDLVELKSKASTIINEIKNSSPYINTDIFQFYLDSLEEINKQLETTVQEEIEKLPDSQTTKNEILALITDIIGEPYTQSEIDAIEKEGIKRYENKVPPGFEDLKENKKKNFRTYGDFRYQQIYGDLIVWKQMIGKIAGMEDPTPLIFITEDRKEDWWEKDGRKIKKPHPALQQEFLNRTSQKFYMYRTDTFVKLAIEYLGADLSIEQVQHINEDMENIRKLQKTETDALNETTFKFDPVKINDYLNSREKTLFERLLNEAYDDENSNSNHNYNRAIKWAINVSLENMEREYRILLDEIGNYRLRYATPYKIAYDQLSSDENQRYIELYDMIEGMKSSLAYLETSGR